MKQSVFYCAAPGTTFHDPRQFENNAQIFLKQMQGARRAGRSLFTGHRDTVSVATPDAGVGFHLDA